MDPPDLAPLFTALQDDQYRVWWQAERTLLGLSDPAAVPSLLAGLAIPGCRVRAVVARMLGALGDRRAVEPLIALLKTGECGDVRFNVRAEAAKALGQLGDARAVEPLMASLADDDGATRTSALEALGRLGDQRAVEPLLAATRTWQYPSGATILGNLGDQRAVEPLLAELEPLRRAPTVSGSAPADPAARWLAIYRYYVIRALGKLGDPRAVSLLEWIRAHEHEPVLKGKSLGDMATVALRRIAERTAQEAGGELPLVGLPQDPA